MAHAARMDLVAATEAEKCKERRYRDRTSGTKSVPFAVETYGALCARSDRLLVECASLASKGCDGSGPSNVSYRIDSCGATHSAMPMRTVKRPNVLLLPYPSRHFPFYRLTKHRQLSSPSFPKVITTSFPLLIRIPINENSLSSFLWRATMHNVYSGVMK